jgi:regulator of sirC expression with transglutaminase-like and TPR domain
VQEGRALPDDEAEVRAAVAVGPGPLHVARMQESDLTLFAHVALRPEEELDLARAALLIAEPEYPGLDVAGYVERIDRLVATVERRTVEGVIDLVYRRAGFRGNREDYYDPRNSFLNQVIDRRTGIPITLAIVLMEVGRRAGVALAGVSFPSHFLVRSEEGTIIDPFAGAILDERGLRALHERAGGAGGPDARLLAPATKRQILSRMLTNLRGIYSARGDGERLRGVLERMELLAPSDELRDELARLGSRSPSN